MRTRAALTVMTLACIVLLPATALASAAEATRSYDEGRTMLKQGDLDAALAAFKVAAKADPENKFYFREAAVLSRVLNIRRAMADEQDLETWVKMGRLLYNYYHQYQVNKEALALAQQLHGKAASAESAAMLAEAHLELAQDKEAVAVLAALPAEQCDARTKVLHGLALARTGEKEAAAAVAAELEMPEKCGNVLCFDAARLYARLGRDDHAYKMLTCAFESTPANWLPEFRTMAKACADFDDIAETARFAKVLATKSKMTGCGGCASASSCGSSGGSSGCSSEKTACSDKDKKQSCDHEKDAEKCAHDKDAKKCDHEHGKDHKCDHDKKECEHEHGKDHECCKGDKTKCDHDKKKCDHDKK